ncbi:MAG: right-handed parallel beta-helix repeat-containing protein [Terriglobia bacterium]
MNTFPNRKNRELAFGFTAVVLLLLSPALFPARPGRTPVVVGPHQRIQDLVERSREGTSFLIQAGVHRLESVVPKNGDSFVGEPGAILNGAVVIKAFERQGNYWTAPCSIPKVEGPGKCQPQFPACRFPEDLFVDDEPLRRVASLADLAPRTWYLDYAAGRLHLSEDPTGHTVELSVTPHAFYGSATDVTIRGLVIEKYANPAQSGAIHALTDPGPLSHNWLVEGNEIRLNHGAGIRVGHGTHVVENRIHHNGQIGVEGSGANILVEDNEIAYNNYAGYDYGWEAGGTKFTFTHKLVVRNNDVHHNQGPGLWTDGDNDSVLYERNHTAANLVAGIEHEISFAAVIRDNVIENDGFNPHGASLWWGAGIHILASSHVEVYGNTLRNCMNGIAAVQAERGSSRSTGRPYLVQDIDVHDNTVVQSSGTAAGIVKDAHFDDAVFKSWGNRFRGNTYVLGATKGEFYQWMNTPRTREEWQAFGNDPDGKWPALTRSSPADYVDQATLPAEKPAASLCLSLLPASILLPARVSTMLQTLRY